MEERQARRQTRIGRVVSDKMQKTVVVAVETTKRHPLYRRTTRETTRYKAHDERNEAHTGDLVRIAETRPLSKEKRWRVVEIIERGPQAPARATAAQEQAPQG